MFLARNEFAIFILLPVNTVAVPKLVFRAEMNGIELGLLCDRWGTRLIAFHS